MVASDLSLNNFELQEGVYILSAVNNSFEEIYLKVREKEKRVHSDAEVMKLPFASKDNPQKNEWLLRAKTFNRFKKYLGEYSVPLRILDLGCGSGWFSGNLSKYFNHNFFCIDINLKELKQGARVFESEKIKFLFADIFTAKLPEKFFDLIILNASVQYFQNFRKLIVRLSELLKPGGTINIIDSPFYNPADRDAAEQRTKDYYTRLGFPEMASNYFHHTYSELSGYNHEFLYDPASIKNKLLKIFSFKDSPFPWIIIKK